MAISALGVSPDGEPRRTAGPAERTPAGLRWSVVWRQLTSSSTQSSDFVTAFCQLR